MRLILLGCPGAGKGTQAKLIQQQFGIPQISTGDILRAAIAADNELGRKVKAVVEAGQLVSDEIMIELVKQRLMQSDCQQGFLLDGFPRTIAQAKALATITDIDYIVDIDVPDDEIVSRLTGRRIHPGSGRIYHLAHNPPKVEDKDDITGEPLIQRVDDSEATVRNRLKIYHEQTEPLQAYYQQATSKAGANTPKYLKIDGTGSVEQIQDGIFSLLATIRNQGHEKTS